jgi:hypothetical protein
MSNHREDSTNTIKKCEQTPCERSVFQIVSTICRNQLLLESLSIFWYLPRGIEYVVVNVV